ncbi:hypothetical protein [Herbaspirillum camelliae]|uniref:hypothetical protein n=1 Tax=Herbaspirillum camelliae TaxID=1892903 RepID=UPI0013014621|nr:hypothetical protein [Herbaspirillum camelliae]
MNTVAGRTDTELTQKLLEKLEVKFTSVEKSTNADGIVTITNWAAIRSAIPGVTTDTTNGTDSAVRALLDSVIASKANRILKAADGVPDNLTGDRHRQGRAGDRRYLQQGPGTGRWREQQHQSGCHCQNHRHRQ